uniref:Glycolipid transfer protein domain-containing protein n=1 Tax=Lactuca sativa TaxID=4236 RepID=A0A9R1UQV8_LACSA|nr:hypothetical protein LSAT_V11C800437130 [Lactuca sativa]
MRVLSFLCSFVSVLFIQNPLFGFQVRDLEEASEHYVSLSSVVDYDVKWKSVKSHGSHTHNLRRVRQDATSSAYQQVCAPYHSWAIRTAFSAGICALPSREQLLLNLNETG